MEGRLAAFIIWTIMGVLFIVMGIYDFNSKKAKPFGFWANAEAAPIEDVVRVWCIVYHNWIAFIRWAEFGFDHYTYIGRAAY